MLIFRGRGIIVAGIALASLTGMEVFTRMQFHDDHYYEEHGWPKLAAFLLAAVIVWLLLGQREETIEVASTAPEQAFRERRSSLFRPTDSLFYIPVRFWPITLCGLGVVYYFVRA